jgi:hypothetical protein
VSALRRLKRWFQGVAALPELPRTIAQAEYLQREVERLRAAQRRSQLDTAAPEGDAAQTRASFDFQWRHMPSGAALPTDDAFMGRVAADLTGMVARRFPGGTSSTSAAGSGGTRLDSCNWVPR